MTNSSSLGHKLRELQRAAASRLPADGLGPSLLGEDTGVLRQAAPALAALHRWLEETRAPVPAAVADLLGLGPGSTPSGDDYLVGTLVALHAFGEEEAAGKLWGAVRGDAQTRTRTLSVAHLAAAAAGHAHPALHRCVSELVRARPPRWEEPLDQLGAVGHCSGWDALAGVAAVARAHCSRSGGSPS